MQRSIPPNKGMNKHGYICLYMLNDMLILRIHNQLNVIFTGIHYIMNKLCN